MEMSGSQINIYDSSDEEPEQTPAAALDSVVEAYRAELKAANDDKEELSAELEEANEEITYLYNQLNELNKRIDFYRTELYPSDWPLKRDGLARAFYAEWNNKVAGGRLNPDMEVVWSNRMHGIAGKTCWRPTTHIRLSSKLVTNETRMRETLAHELCHAATKHLSPTYDVHGINFHAWGARTAQAFPSIRVTRTHRYNTLKKYVYKCRNCPKVYKRHTKSINIAKQRCGRCKTGILSFGHATTLR